MAIPAYMWLKDDGGSAIKGSVDVNGREDSVEIVEFQHNVRIPTDANTGKLTAPAFMTYRIVQRIRCVFSILVQSRDHRPNFKRSRNQVVSN